MINSLLYHYFKQCLLLTSLWLVSGLAKSQAQDINPAFFRAENKLSQFILRNWSTEDGLPSSTLLEVTQSKDGYIWTSSYDGLIRFDGHHFYTFNKRNGKKLQSTRFSKLLSFADNEIWIGTNQDGLLKVQDKSLTGISPALEDLQVQAFCLDRYTNRLWIGAKQGLYFLENEVLRRVRFDGVTDIGINDLYQDHDGILWVVTGGKGISRYVNGKWESLASPYDIVYRVSARKHGKIWFNHPNGLLVYDQGSISIVPIFEGMWTYRVIENQAGDLLVATIKGLCRILKGNEPEWLTMKDGLPDHEVTDMAFDREGSLWIATYRGGLVQLAESKFNNFSQEDGLASKGVSMVYEMEPNTFWVGGLTNTINIIQHQAVNTANVTIDLPNRRIYDILKDRNKRTWIATYYGLMMINETGKTTYYTTKNGMPNDHARVLLEDSHENIWVGTKSGGLVKISPDLKFQIVNMETRGLSDNFIMDIDEDRQQRLIVSTNDGGLNVIHPDLSIEQFTVAEGLPKNLIFNSYIDASGTIWLATKGGISRFDGKNFVNIQQAEGIPAETIFDIIEDDYGFLWATSSKGIIKVSKEALNEFAGGNKQAIHWHIYDKQDGMRESECTAATSSLKASDGTLWFPTIDGLAVIHPKNDKINTVSPYVKITSFLVDNQNKPLHQQQQLNADAKRLIFDFAGLSLLAPDKVHYRYKLEGFDDELIFTDERKANYTNLSYGYYTFKVWASNNDGIWSEQPATLSFSITRPFWAKAWFIILCALFAISIGVLVHKIRVRSIKAQKRLLEGKVQERTKDLQTAKERVEAINTQVLNQNKELEQQREEIMAQRDEIEAQNKNLLVQKNQIEDKNIEIQRNQSVIERQNNQLREMNLELESKVQKRTVELQKAYQDLLKAHKQVDHFTYRSAHDLKGPIARLLGLCYLGRMEVADELGLKYMNMLESTAQQMGTLLNKLLRTHEIRTVKIRPEIMNLHQLVRSIWERLYGFSDTITFTLLPQADIQHIVDPNLTEILLENLINNAIQYRDRNKNDSYLTITMNQTQDHVVIHVKDNGIGIPSEVGNKVFEMFMKGTERSEGAGLGLYEAKVIVEERLGGKIWLKNFGEGEETEIEVILPFISA